MSIMISRYRLTWLIAAAVSSGLLQAAAFPPLENAALGWMAFVPLLSVLVYASPRMAFRLGAISGSVFWLLTTAWLLRLAAYAPLPLVIVGWIALSVYAALYTAVFAWIYRFALKGLPFGVLGRNITLLIGGPMVWSGLEYLRCRLFGGFPWNPLGVSQYANLPLIQIAEWTGVHGVSALVMLFNISLSLTLLRYVDPTERRRGFHLELAMAALLLALCWRVGLARERIFQPVTGELLFAVVQPGIPQTAKWEEGQAEKVMDRIGTAVKDAVFQSGIFFGRPADLVILPETVLPYYADHPDSIRFMDDVLRAIATPILAGVMASEFRDQQEQYYNRSVLYHPDAAKSLQFYDKQHLVPFGEVIPFSRQIPWLERFAPLGWNCTPGSKPVVFDLPDTGATFGVTICFEDAFPYISRRFALAGARLLINQTNDAWFDPSSAPRQHLAQSVFRSVETRLPTVRAANTGISALIDRSGRIRAELPPTDQTISRASHALWRVTPAPADARLTVFTRFGDRVFALPCAVLAVAAAILVFLSNRSATTKSKSRGTNSDESDACGQDAKI